MGKAQRISILLFISIAALSMLSGCTSRNDEGFAIYLTRDDIPPVSMEVLSNIEKSSEPILTEHDIVSYDAKDHSILLEPDAFLKFNDLELSTRGKSFLVCVDGFPIYWGAFWTPLSSMSFEGVVIMLPSFAGENIVNISLGYPGESFYKGSDPRNDKRILDTLEKAGKLTGKP
ncbi:hypothetical protein J2Z34_001790 [Youngiibacter multivorans]|uniref:Lipoprotein n=2 Tax=Youngiibacter multivorans TaxID=937251 RepID=A0ABS4G438_9CLOT|nr:hypothetical protein [Youngiibacter multivorans]